MFSIHWLKKMKQILKLNWGPTNTHHSLKIRAHSTLGLRQETKNKVGKEAGEEKKREGRAVPTAQRGNPGKEWQENREEVVKITQEWQVHQKVNEERTLVRETWIWLNRGTMSRAQAASLQCSSEGRKVNGQRKPEPFS